MLYAPRIITKYDEFDKYLPIGTIDYLELFQYGYLFDWTYLYKMDRLRVLYVDNINFVYEVIASLLELGSDLGMDTFFDEIPSLQELYIGNEKVTRASRSTEESLPMKKKIAQGRRIYSLCHGARRNIFQATGGFSDFTINHLKDYYVNRGDKKFYRWGTGVVVNSLLAVFGLGLDLGVHAVANTGKNLFNLGANAFEAAEANEDRRLNFWFDNDDDNTPTYLKENKSTSSFSSSPSSSGISLDASSLPSDAELTFKSSADGMDDEEEDTEYDDE